MVSLLKLVLMTLSQTQTGEVSGGGEGGGVIFSIPKNRGATPFHRKDWS